MYWGPDSLQVGTVRHVMAQHVKRNAQKMPRHILCAPQRSSHSSLGPGVGVCLTSCGTVRGKVREALSPGAGTLKNMVEIGEVVRC
jgi:hypothetical protein